MSYKQFNQMFITMEVCMIILRETNNYKVYMFDHECYWVVDKSSKEIVFKCSTTNEYKSFISKEY